MNEIQVELSGWIGQPRDTDAMKQPIENPLIPMGALTGRPTRGQIRRILTKYREAGIEQYLIYPRSGCELEYLSDEYFDTVAAICEEAEKLGFTSIWLYDEFNWPSGSCAHRVPHENPDFAMRFLCAVRTPDGIKVEVRRNPDYTDLMNPAAVDRFIALTHERYYARLKPWFGKLIKGIFTDEPDIGFFGKEGWNKLFCMGYYEGMADDYRKLTGGDLFADIAAGVRSVLDYYPTVCARLLAERFRTCFIDRVQAWCDAHGVVLTGHLMDEVLPLPARKSNGRILPVLSGMGLPGMDDIRAEADLGGFEFMTYSSLMYAVEKRRSGGLAELFAICRTDITFAWMTQFLYLAAAFGVDHYVLAVAAMDPRGNADKTDYYDSFACDVPQLLSFPAWGKEARRAARMARLPRRYEVAVRYGDNDPALPSLLRELASYQISWCFLTPEDPVPEDIPVVLAVTPRGVVEERTRTWAPNFAVMRPRLSETLYPDSEVRHEDGSLAREVFVRRYQDGTVLVVNMADRAQRLVLHRGGNSVGFELSRHGVREFPGWRVEFDHPHIQRLEFDGNGHAELELAHGQALRLALRHYRGTAEIVMNGQTVAAKHECNALPESFRELYREADLGTLPAGKYTFTADSDIRDYPFLPTAILLGGQLPAYTGRVMQSAEVILPVTARSIHLVGTVPPPGDMTLFLNGQSLGCRLQGPYEWSIPEALSGKEVSVRIEYSSSISALFGNPWRGADALSHTLQGYFAPDYRSSPAPLEISFD